MYKRDFRTKVYSMYVYSVLILSLVALVSFSGYSMYEFNEKEKRNTQNVLNSVAQSQELQFTEVKKIRDSFYFNGVFQKAEQMNNPQLYKYYAESKMIEIENSYTITLQKMMHTSSQKIRNIVFFPISGGNCAYCLGKGSSEIRCVQYEGYEEESWFQEAVTDPQRAVYYEPHIPSYTENERLGQVYSYISGVKNQDTHKLIGILKVDVDASEMIDTLKMFTEDGENEVALFKEGKVFAQSGKLKEDLSQYLATKQMIPNTNLEVVYLNMAWSQYGGFIYILIGAVLVMLFAILLAFLNYKRQAAKMVNDVNQIMAVVQEVELGRMDRRIQIPPDSEYVEIADMINQMLDRLEGYIEREYILVIQQQEAQYKALQSQINPHFLYNTLNGFVALNRMGEKEILEKSIIELSRLFRYTCSAQDVVFVKEEMAFLQDYLKLEKLKYDDKLEYEIQMDAECEKREIPKLLLQPIVENSIKYGRGNTNRTMRIEISAKCRPEGRMILRVKDNGVGFDVNGKLDAGQHLGIENVYTRAKLYCENVKYRCTSGEDIGTETVFVFPEGDEDNAHTDRR